MKTVLKVTILALVVAFAFTLGICFAPILKNYRSARAGKYLPDIPPIRGISVINQETTSSSRFAARHFVFRASDSNIQNSADVMSRVEAALQATGWEKMQTSTSPAVSVTQWRHKEKFGGGLYLLLSIVQLNAGTQHYFGTVEAFPFWRDRG